MSKEQIRHLIERRLPRAGVVETALKGVQLFRVTEPVPCVPAVYEPTVVAILGGTKEAVLDGQHHVYDSGKYLLCPMTLPVEAGSPQASPDDPLLGVMIALEPRVMRELAIGIETAAGGGVRSQGKTGPALALASWDTGFTQALLRLLELLDDPMDAAVLGDGRLRELYYAVLRGEAGAAARRAFGIGNEIARTIDYLATRLNEPVSIDDLADHAGMSRAVFHRRFKEATTMSPIQFVKSMRLNHAAMKIAGGKTVSEAAWDVGYQSASQFSREFKRMYGQSPRPGATRRRHRHCRNSAWPAAVAIYEKTSRRERSTMDTLKASTDWARAELLSNGVSALFGVMFLAASSGFWLRGESEMARAFVIPMLVAGVLLVLFGGGLFYGTWKSAAGFASALTHDPAGFVAAENARAERTMATYSTAVFKVMPLMIAAAALLLLFVQTPGWRAALITAIVFLGLLMVIDSNANARLETYRATLLSAG